MISMHVTNIDPVEVNYVRLAILLAIVVFFLAALAALLSNERTRKGTLVFLGLAGGLTLLSLLAMYYSYEPVGEPATPRRAEAPPAISKPMAEAPQLKAAGGKAAHAKSPAAEKRPAWIDSPPGRQGDAYRETVLIGPYTTRVECDGKVPEALQRAMAEYAELYLGRRAPPASAFHGDDIEGAIVKDRFEETIQSSVGPMIQLHLLLEFDRAVQERIRKAAERAVIDRRLWRTGTVSIAVLGLLAVALAYLKADLTTGGAHRRRLRLGALFAAALLLLAAWLSFRVG